MKRRNSSAADRDGQHTLGLNGRQAADPGRLESLFNLAIDPTSCMPEQARTLAILIRECVIADIRDLEPAFNACASIYSVQEDEAYVEWQSADGKIDRRPVGPFLALALKKLPPRRRCDLALRDLLQSKAVADLYPGTEAPEELANRIVLDVRAWAGLWLPPRLSTHVSGRDKFSLLPASCLARQASQLALAPTEEASAAEGEQSTEDLPPTAAFELVLDLSYDRHAGGTGNAHKFQGQLMRALRPPSRGSVASKRSHITKAVNGLAQEARKQCEAMRILYCLALHLHAFGTTTKPTSAPGTPYDYIQAIGDAFLVAFGQFDFMSADADQYRRALEAILGADPSSKTVAACQELHNLLVSLDLAPEAEIGRIAGKVEMGVVANRLHAHEVDLMLRWLGDAPQIRVNLMVKAAVHILRSEPVRITELMYCRLEGMRVTEGRVEIDIAPRLSDPRLKSRAGRRRLSITDPVAVASLTEWFQRRVEETKVAKGEAIDSDRMLPQGLLFGDPNSAENIFMPARFMRTLNELIKAATGDRTLSTHVFRHTHGSDATERAYRSQYLGEVNPLDDDAVVMGHADGRVKLRSYSHEIEAALRHLVDQRSDQAVPLTSATASYWSGLSALTIRQRVSRAGRRSGVDMTGQQKESSRRSEYLKVIRAAAANVQFTSVASRFRLAVPVPPAILLQARAIGPKVIFNLLADIKGGTASRVAGLRQDIPEDVLERVLREIGRLSDRFTGRRNRSQSDAAMGVEALCDESGKKLGAVVDFKRAERAREQLVLNYINSNPDENEILPGATRYWVSNVQGSSWLASPGGELGSLVQLLLNAKVNPSHLSVVVNAGSPEAGRTAPAAVEKAGFRQGTGAADSDTLAYITSFISKVTHQGVQVLELSHRRGRPMHRLVIASPNEPGRDPQGLGRWFLMSGMNAVFLAAHVFQALEIKAK